MAKYLLISVGFGVAAGALLYYLLDSKKEESDSFDRKLHSQEKLLILLEELYLKRAMLTVFTFQILEDKDKQGNLTLDFVNRQRTRLEQIYTQNLDDVAIRNNITLEFLILWIEKYQSDQKVQQALIDIKSLQEQCLRREIKQFNYQLPESLTPETYLNIEIKYQAAIISSICLRMKAEGLEKLTKEQIHKYRDQIEDEQIIQLHTRALKLYNVNIPETENPIDIMNKAYLTFTAQSNYVGDQQDNVFLKNWNSKIMKVFNKKVALFYKIYLGEPIVDIEVDPLLTPEIPSYFEDYDEVA